MTRKVLLILIAACFSISASFSQDKLLLISGKEKTVSSFDLKNPEWVQYKLANSKKNKIKKIDRFDVFAIEKSDGTEQIIYTPDTANGDPSVDWVRAYIKGQQYGRLHKKQRWNSVDGEWHRKVNFLEVGGVIVGGAGSLLSFYGIPVPAVYALVVGRINSNLPPATDIEEQYRTSESFKFGYQKQRRNQRIKQAFISGMIGFAVGVTTFTIIGNNQ